jgi:hypothetical protein
MSFWHIGEESCPLVGVSTQNLYGKGKKMHLSSIDCCKILLLLELPLLWSPYDIKQLKKPNLPNWDW